MDTELYLLIYGLWLPLDLTLVGITYLFHYYTSFYQGFSGLAPAI